MFCIIIVAVRCYVTICLAVWCYITMCLFCENSMFVFTCIMSVDREKFAPKIMARVLFT